MKLSNKIKIIDNSSGIVLFEKPEDQSDYIYSKLVELELLGLDVRLETPNIVNQLAMLFIDENNSEQLSEFQDSITHELMDHDGQCCEE